MTLIGWTAVIAGSLFAIGACCAAVRLRRGPGLLDRAAALDVLLAIVVGVIVLYADVTDSAVTLVIAAVVALLGFLGTASLARLLPGDPEPDEAAGTSRRRGTAADPGRRQSGSDGRGRRGRKRR